MRPTNALRAGVLAVLAALLLLVPVTAASAAVPGLHLVVGGSGASSQNKSATAECPGDEDLLGIGGHVSDGDNQVLLDALAPSTHAATVHASEDQDGTGATWAVQAYAICADDGVGAEVRSTTLPFPDGDSMSPKFTSTADNGPCTNDHRLTSAAGEIIDGIEGQEALTALIPSADLESASARAFEDQDGTNSTWRLRATAVCSATTLPGLERVVATGPSNSRNKHATARCPDGKRVVGTGGEILGGTGQVGITYLLPDEDLTRVHVRGAEDQDGTNANWAVRAYAVCATA